MALLGGPGALVGMLSWVILGGRLVAESHCHDGRRTSVVSGNIMSPQEEAGPVRWIFNSFVPHMGMFMSLDLRNYLFSMFTYLVDDDTINDMRECFTQSCEEGKIPGAQRGTRINNPTDSRADSYVRIHETKL